MTNRTWDREDLQRRLCHALDVAKKTIRRLGESGYTDATDARISVRPEKVVSETALLLIAASPAAESEEVRRRIDDIARDLIPYVRSEQMLLSVCLEPSLALDYAAGHVFLSRLGYPDSGFDELLDKALTSHAREGRERVPHRMIEQQWIRKYTGAGGGKKGRKAPAGFSALNYSMDLLGGTRDDVYAFTHALMYVMDFCVLPERLPRARRTILAEAEGALGRCLDDEDYDLGGEVLLAWPLTGCTWSPAATFGFRVHAGVEDAAGFLPAPLTRVQRLGELEGEERADYLLATAYHTVYVMGLLCAAALQPGRTPPIEIAKRGARKVSIDWIVEALERDQRRPHWWNDFLALDEGERGALGELLLGIALRREAVRRDYRALADLLRRGNEAGLTNTPIAQQAAELLDRLAVFGKQRMRASRVA